jgi:lipopolysaccharide export system protein LptC
MASNPSANRRQFTPRARPASDDQRPSRRLSVILLGIGAILTLAVASWLGFLHKSTDSKLEIKDVTIASNGDIELTGARYQGVTSGGQPFQITADQATETPDGSGRVDMTQPRATVTMKNGQTINIKSNYGVFAKQADSVDMTGSVVVVHRERNLTMTSEAIFANLKRGEMHSNVPVVVEDDDTRIDAETMTVFDNGDRMVFGGTARMVMQNGKGITTITN